ncbi:MAG: uroporphyrinogen decarboxylase family protein [Armatimonadota bacterium]
MALSDRENYLRTASMTGGEWIPMHIVISGATWDQLREELEDVLVHHPHFFPDFEKGQRDYDARQFHPQSRAGGEFVDNYGCVWHGEVDGIVGIVDGHPLEDWDDFEDFEMPDPRTQLPLGPVDWGQVRERMAARKQSGELLSAGTEHGFLFMRLYYLRGFENLMLDMATGEPRLQQLIDMIVEYTQYQVQQYLDMGVDVFGFAEDLGAQDRSVMGPRMFERWLAPAYRRLMQSCRDQGVHVHNHTDGYVLDIIEQLIDCGVTICNVQDLIHGVEILRDELKGRVCIDLDIDRQSVVPHGTPQEIEELIEYEVRTLGSPNGGLMMTIGIYPPTPPENIDAVLSAMRKYQRFWWD